MIHALTPGPFLTILPVLAALPCHPAGTLDLNSVMRSFAAVSAANGSATPSAAAAAAAAATHANSLGAHLASPPPLMTHHRTASAANTPRSPAAAAAAEAAMAAAVAADAAAGGSPVQGLVPQHLLMSHTSHVSSSGGGGGMGGLQAGEGASLVLNAAGIGGKGMMGGGGAGLADANILGSPIPSVAAAALVDLAGAGHSNGGQGFAGLDPSWGWGMDGGLTSAPSQVGPSCITTGME
jgi:hypothetical protein